LAGFSGREGAVLLMLKVDVLDAKEEAEASFR
jgi:hypothetical protein